MVIERRIRDRGIRTIELPFLASCALYLLDRRYWIVGIRYPWYGVRFDVVARDPSLSANVVLVEAKYRADGRPVRPYEVERFQKELQRAATTGTPYYNAAIFMTNTRFSAKALELCKEYGIRAIDNVPVVFRSCDEKRTNEREAEPEEREGEEHENE